MSGRMVVEWVGSHRAVLGAAILGAVAIGVAAFLIRRPEDARIVVQQPITVAAARPAASPQVPALIVVHLSGEVIAPGVYRLPVGARVDDALRAAGGATSDGDIHRLNLAARLADGQQIVVPRRPIPPLPGSPVLAVAVPGRVNLNTATVAELDRLPGVGPVTAQRIVAYREQHGAFSRIEQLREAKLVNASTFEKIKDLVTV